MASSTQSGPRSRHAILALVCVLIGVLAYRTYVPTFDPRPLRVDQSIERIDLNRADRVELSLLPGVGPQTADAILAYREQSGGFESVEDLSKIHGIGPKTLDKLRPLVSVKSSKVLPPVDQLEKLQRHLTTTNRSAKIIMGEARINVNTAMEDDLKRLPGIGPAMASRIIETRDQKPFANVDELRRVRGIGPKILEGLKPFVTVE